MLVFDSSQKPTASLLFHFSILNSQLTSFSILQDPLLFELSLPQCHLVILSQGVKLIHKEVWDVYLRFIKKNLELESTIVSLYTFQQNL